MIHSQLWRIRSYLFAFEALCEGTDGTAALLPLGAHIWHVCAVEVHCTLELEVLPVLHNVVNERLAAGQRVAYDIVDLRESGPGTVRHAAARCGSYIGGRRLQTALTSMISLSLTVRSSSLDPLAASVTTLGRMATGGTTK